MPTLRLNFLYLIGQRSMLPHILIDILLGLIVLTVWLNIANGYLRILISETSNSIRTSLSNLTIIFIPFFIDLALFQARSFPEIPNFATIPITSFATATGVFLVNLELESKKQKREKLKIAKILACVIEAQVEDIDSFQKARAISFSREPKDARVSG